MTVSQAEPGPARFPVSHGAGLALAVFVSHLPFLSPGFGTDSDTWKFASAIREIATTGRYVSSRPPGYPLMEFTSVPFHALGAIVPNALSAVAAAACAWLVARLLARHGVRDAWWGGAAFAFVPAAFIAGTSSMDYLWALAFVLAAWLDASDGRAGRAGIWLGLAAASRLTSFLFAPSLVLLLFQSAPAARGHRLVRFALTSCVLAALWYVPVFLTYRWGMFTYSEITGGQSSALGLLSPVARPGTGSVSWSLIAGQGTVLLWGALGCLGVVGMLAALPWQSRTAPRAAVLPRAWLWPFGLAIALEVLLYLRLPHDEGYLLPVVPLALVAMASLLTAPRFRVLCAALLLSPFLCGVDIEPPKKGATPAGGSPLTWRLQVGGQSVVVEPLRGPVPRDHAKRVEMDRLARAVRAWWPQRPERFQIVAGSSYAMLYHLFPLRASEHPFIRSLTAGERATARAAGIALFALPDGLRRMQENEGTDHIDHVTVLAAPEGF